MQPLITAATWLGGVELGGEGSFRWTDDSAFDVALFPVGQPDDAGGAEDCLATFADAQLNDDNCNTLHVRLCEIDAPIVARCGDGIIDGGEACDDVNVVDGDGCSAACAIEPTFTCVGLASVCANIVINVASGDDLGAQIVGAPDGALLLVAPGNYAVSASLTNKDIAIVGTGPGVALQANIGVGVGASLRLVNVRASSVGANEDVLTVSGNGSLLVEDSVIGPSEDDCIRAVNDQSSIIVTRSRVEGCGENGVQVRRNFIITNTVITGCGADGSEPALLLDVGPTVGLVLHVTIAGNLGSGISCDPGLFVGHSIFADNDDGALDGSGCAIAETMFDGGAPRPGIGNLVADPLFVGPTDFHLQATSPARDRAGISLTLRDIDGESRDLIPDLGADEVP